jgi:hypothetical protein
LWQRQPLLTPGLAAYDDLPLFPVKVVKPELCDFAGTQAESRQQ